MIEPAREIPTVSILHQYGAPAHFTGLIELERRGRIRLEWGEFDLLRQAARTLLRKNGASAFRTGHNAAWIPRLFAPGGPVVVGAAPYDSIVLLLRMIARRRRVTYFTSWPFWNGDDGPRKPFLPRTRTAWAEFLKGRRTVAVTRLAAEAVATAGADAHHIPHGVDTEMFQPGAPRDSRRARLLFVGQLTTRKGVPYLVDLARSGSVDAEFWFVGDGPLRASIMQLQEEGRARWFGRVSNRAQLAELYRSVDALVLASADNPPDEIENFGIVLLEAMASGLPVITTDTVGPKEVVVDGETGILVPQRDERAFAHAIQHVITDTAFGARLGRNGRQIALEKYSLATVASAWEAVLGPSLSPRCHGDASGSGLE